MSSSIDSLVGTRAGETLFVCGNSFSLAPLDLTPLSGRCVVAVNRALRHPVLASETQYLLVVDSSVVTAEKQRLLTYAGRLVVFQGVLGKFQRLNLKAEGFLINRRAKPDALFGPLRHTGNTGYYATQLAFRLGAKRIVLLGIDLEWPLSKASHFFGPGFNEGCRLVQPVQKLVDEFKSLTDLYGSVGVTVLNASPHRGPMDGAMPHVEFEEVLKWDE